MKVTQNHIDLDTILTLLNSNNTSSFSLIEIVKFLYPDKYRFFVDESKGNDIFDIQNVETEDAQKIYRLIILLKEQELVHYNEINQSVIITVKGVLKIESESFEEEIERKNSNLKLQRWSWRWLPWIGFLTLGFTFLTFVLSLIRVLHDVFCLIP